MIAELPAPTPKDMIECRDRKLTWPQLYAARLGQSPDSTPEEKRRSAAWWQEEQREVYKVFKGLTCRVYWLSQSRNSKQTPGLGDLWVFAPKGWRLAWWWETKAGRGELSDAQEDFRDSCLETGVLWGSGDRYDAQRFLIQLGIAYRHSSGSIELLRRPHSDGRVSAR